MAPSRSRANEASSPATKRWLILGGIAVALVALWMLWPTKAPPPLATDPAVRETIDALFTAFTSRRVELLDDCDQRLKKHHEAGRLSDPSRDYLAKLAAQARAGNWESSARQLYAYINAP